MSVLGAWLLKQAMTPKNWLYVTVLVLVGYLGYSGYNWIWDRGYQKRTQETDKKIVDLTAERNTAVDNYNIYKGTYDNWVKKTKEAQEKYLAEQAEDLNRRENRLAAAEQAARNKPTKIKEVIRYVPAQVDATFRLPTGLVSLYRDSIEGTSAFNPKSGDAQSFSFDAGEASPLAVSQFGQIAASNNAECVLRGKVIAEWQDWYRTNETKFKQFQDWQAANAPKPAEGQ